MTAALPDIKFNTIALLSTLRRRTGSLWVVGPVVVELYDHGVVVGSFETHTEAELDAFFQGVESEPEPSSYYKAVLKPAAALPADFDEQMVVCKSVVDAKIGLHFVE